MTAQSLRFDYTTFNTASRQRSSIAGEHSELWEAIRRDLLELTVIYVTNGKALPLGYYLVSKFQLDFS